MGARDHCLLCRNYTKVAAQASDPDPGTRPFLAFSPRSGILSLVQVPIKHARGGRRWHDPVPERCEKALGTLSGFDSRGAAVE